MLVLPISAVQCCVAALPHGLFSAYLVSWFLLSAANAALSAPASPLQHQAAAGLQAVECLSACHHGVVAISMGMMLPAAHASLQHTHQALRLLGCLEDHTHDGFRQEPGRAMDVGPVPADRDTAAWAPLHYSVLPKFRTQWPHFSSLDGQPGRHA